MALKSPKNLPPPERDPAWDTPQQFNEEPIHEEVSQDIENIDVDLQAGLQFGAPDAPQGESVSSFTDSPPPLADIKQIPRPSYLKPVDAEPEVIKFGEAPADPTPEPPSPPLPDPEPLPPAAGPIESPTATKDQMTLMLEIVNKALDTKAQHVNVSPVMGSMTYEQMVVAVLSIGCEQYMTKIRECADSYAQGSLAGWLNGLVSLVGDRGDLGEIAYNADWAGAVQGQTQFHPNNYGNGAISTCEHCGHSFRLPTSGNIRQRFCCNACGKRAVGYTEEPEPHSADCTTQVGKELRAALAAATTVARAA